MKQILPSHIVLFNSFVTAHSGKLAHGKLHANYDLHGRYLFKR